MTLNEGDPDTDGRCRGRDQSAALQRWWQSPLLLCRRQGLERATLGVLSGHLPVLTRRHREGRRRLVLHLTQGHASYDGNKRTALIASLTLLDINGWSIEYPLDVDGKTAVADLIYNLSASMVE